jgi:maltose O-acetyltransferase
MNKFITSVISTIAALQITPDKVRVKLLRLTGWKIGSNTAISYGVFSSASDVTIGNNVYIGPHAYLDAHGGIAIGDFVRIGSHLKMLTRSHPIGEGDIRANHGDDVDVHTSIGHGSWIAANVTILPGANVADSCIIGAGAVVTKPTKNRGKYFGVPARQVA